MLATKVLDNAVLAFSIMTQSAIQRSSKVLSVARPFVRYSSSVRVRLLVDLVGKRSPAGWRENIQAALKHGFLQPGFDRPLIVVTERRKALAALPTDSQ